MPARSRSSSSVPSPSTTCDPSRCARATDSGVTSTTTNGVFVALELRGDAPADTAVSADDHVIAQLFDLPPPPSLTEDVAEDAAGDGVDHDARDVEEDCHAREEQDDREDLARVGVGSAVQPRERRRDDRTVEGVDPPLAEKDLEPDGPDGEDRGEHGHGPCEATPVGLVQHSRHRTAARCAR